jgi:2-amino-4-hydroxy-6-hydroxymethyldihydropteridine diphosphokinase
VAVPRRDVHPVDPAFSEPAHAELALPGGALAAEDGIEVVAVSTLRETEPVGVGTQPLFLNGAVAADTELSPRALLEALLAIERAEGRERGARWAPRTLDLDIVRYGRERLAEPDLIIPHPELPNRDFWQRELAELQADER